MGPNKLIQIEVSEGRVREKKVSIFVFLMFFLCRRCEKGIE